MKGIIITEEIFNAFCGGDESTMESIIYSYYPKIKVFIRNVVKSELDAEEVTQDVFVKLWQSRERISSPNSLVSYLYRIAINESINFLSKAKADIISYSDTFSLEYESASRTNYTHDAENEYRAKELELITRLLIDKMPPQRREVLIMSRLNEMSNEEISRKLNISIRTVEGHIYKALIQLKKVLLAFLVSIIFVF